MTLPAPMLRETRFALRRSAAPGWWVLLPGALRALVALCGGLCCAFVLAALLRLARGDVAWVLLHLAIHALGLVVLCTVPGAALRLAMRKMAVVQARRLPRQGARQTVRDWHLLLAVLLVLMLLPDVLMAALRMAASMDRVPRAASPMELLASPLRTLYFAGVLLMASAAWQGVVKTAWLTVVPLALLEWPLRHAGFWPTGAASVGWGAAVMALSFPGAWALCAQQLGRRAAAAPQRRPSPGPTPGSIWQAVRRDLRQRWQPLDGESTPIGAIGMLLYVVPSASLLSGALPSWGADVTVNIVPRLAWLTLIVLPVLRSPPMHWRHQLAPGGTYRSRLGWQIAGRTILGLAVTAALLAAVWTLLAAALRSRAFQVDDGWKWLAFTATWGPELLVAVGMASLLRALATRHVHGLRWARMVLTAIVVAFVLVWASLVMFDRAATLSSWTALRWRYGLHHMAGLLALALALLWASARAWARADLHPWMQADGKAG